MEVVENPPMPFWGRIPNGLQPGRMIIISGFVMHGANRFEVDFARGNSRNDCDMALHFNPRFDQRVIVRNSFENHKWGNEEREPYTLPFIVGKEFSIIFLIENTHFKIAVNGRHYTEFKHRLPYQTVDKLNIEGGVKIMKIEYSFESFRPLVGPQICPPAPSVGQMYPPTYGVPQTFPPAPGIQVCPPAPQGKRLYTKGPYLPTPTNCQPVYNPKMPFSFHFIDSLTSGTMFYISGRVIANPNSFTVNFQCDIGSNPPADLALHFNPRFDQKIVVRNSLINDRWGAEERYGGFPFSPGTHFDMLINIESDKYMVAINGMHFIDYKHRIMPLHRISHIDFKGDLVLSCFKISSPDLPCF